MVKEYYSDQLHGDADGLLEFNSKNGKKNYGSVGLVAFVVGIRINGILPFADQ
jgi:hypothetical protein